MQPARQHIAANQQTHRVGSWIDAEGVCTFHLWAPNAAAVDLRVVEPVQRVIPMQAADDGYFHLQVDDVPEGSLYYYSLGGDKQRPDPASKRQPRGVHGPSQLISAHSPPPLRWFGLDLDQYIFYELHVGTFTPEGTLDAIVGRLDRLQDLGITAIELMPIAEFPGSRNWGYDGVYPFAVHHCYGDPDALRRLANECHRRNMALVLDVVYNHLGPEGNYLRDFGPYFTNRYATPWGDAINFDGPLSDHVRRFFIENALYWIENCGIDALRLDAVHAIHDHSGRNFLRELSDEVHATGRRLGRRVFLIAECDLNDARLLHPPVMDGFGLDAQWSDDFHHSLHTLLTKESTGYYRDFGLMQHLATAYEQGWVYSGQYSVCRQRRFGNSPARLTGKQFVVCAQNHDQVGNRMNGDRLGHLVGFEAKKLAAAAVLLSPFLPLLFMGEEYDEVSPFLYFVSHSDPDLLRAVRNGRREEFRDFLDLGEPPDPGVEETFMQSKLSASFSEDLTEGLMWRYYRELIRLRKSHHALRSPNKHRCEVTCLEEQCAIVLRRHQPEDQAVVLFHFGPRDESIPLCFPRGEWHMIFDSAAEEWAVLIDRRTHSDFTLIATSTGSTWRRKVATCSPAGFVERKLQNTRRNTL